MIDHCTAQHKAARRGYAKIWHPARLGEAWSWCSCWSSKPVGLRKGTGRFDSYLLPPFFGFCGGIALHARRNGAPAMRHIRPILALVFACAAFSICMNQPVLGATHAGATTNGAAPADEYFGRMKMSYLGINNSLRDAYVMAGEHTVY